MLGRARRRPERPLTRSRAITTMTPRRLIVLRIIHPKLNAAIERHPDLALALTGRLNAPNTDQDADATWHHEDRKETKA